MWIRSQDKKTLTFCDEMEASLDAICGRKQGGEWCVLGKYRHAGDAMDALNAVAVAIRAKYSIFTMPGMEPEVDNEQQ